jgi:hypothetical protein
MRPEVGLWNSQAGQYRASPGRKPFETVESLFRGSRRFQAKKTKHDLIAMAEAQAAIKHREAEAATPERRRSSRPKHFPARSLVQTTNLVASQFQSQRVCISLSFAEPPEYRYHIPRDTTHENDLLRPPRNAP